MIKNVKAEEILKHISNRNNFMLLSLFNDFSIRVADSKLLSSEGTTNRLLVVILTNDGFKAFTTTDFRELLSELDKNNYINVSHFRFNRIEYEYDDDDDDESFNITPPIAKRINITHSLDKLIEYVIEGECITYLSDNFETKKYGFMEPFHIYNRFSNYCFEIDEFSSHYLGIIKNPHK